MASKMNKTTVEVKFHDEADPYVSMHVENSQGCCTHNFSLDVWLDVMRQANQISGPVTKAWAGALAYKDEGVI